MTRPKIIRLEELDKDLETLLKELKDKIIKARVELLKYRPFFGYLSMFLKFIPVVLPEIAMTRCFVTQDGYVFFNITDWLTSTVEEIKADIVHEIMHLVLEHHSRAIGKDMGAWGYATDCLVNYFISKDGFVLLPTDVTLETVSKITGIPPDKLKDMTAEQIYELLKDKIKTIPIPIQLPIPIKSSIKSQSFPMPNNLPQQNTEDEQKLFDMLKQMQNMLKQAGYDRMPRDMQLPALNGGDSGEEGKERGKYGKGKSKGRGKISDKWRRIWRRRIREAIEVAKSAGTIPDYIKKLYPEFFGKPKVDWRNVLRRFIQESIPFDTSYEKITKRSWIALKSTGIILPGELKEGVDIVVILDTSGSISDAEYLTFIRECKAIADEFQNLNVTLITCDAEVHKGIKDIKDPQQFIREVKEREGFGGTQYSPAFQWIAQNKPDAKGIVFFTDGEPWEDDWGYEAYKKIKHIPILFVITTNKVAPFGQTININP